MSIDIGSNTPSGHADPFTLDAKLIEEVQSIVIGLDVGSTTVKATVVDPATKQILWKDYQRHLSYQAEKAIEFLERIETAFSHIPPETFRIFITGSGSGPLAEHLGAKFVQEVNALTMAVEYLHPDVMSIVELGGQDSKIILFNINKITGERHSWASMNDRCASGTGTTIDKCLIKIGLPHDEIKNVRLDFEKLHHVAAKCGVFAEMDIVNLVKSGVPAEEILCSLGDAIVKQNLSLLARGKTLKPPVLLLGGPLFYLPFLQECWRHRIHETWKERNLDFPLDVPLEELVTVPEDALYQAAYGAVIYGLNEPDGVGEYLGRQPLTDFISEGRRALFGNRAGPALVENNEEYEEFRSKYAIPPFHPPKLQPGSKVKALLGVDGGSTSTKAVLMGEDGTVLQKAYRLSKGNPLQDVKELLAELREHVISQGATLEITGFGSTGYAAGILETALKADVNIVETIAHMNSSVEMFGEVDVICDVGGQDIKVLFLNQGELRNFRLSNQCSAGNGMLLQAMAGQFGVPVEDYAKYAFQARMSPNFSYGCAVFLDSDRVNFQKEGFSREELMAGLALVLPKNIWQYVVQIPRLSSLGRIYVLQGGTQYNLAAVKAQVDYIRERVPDAEIHLHPHPGEAGAIGAAMESLRIVKQRGYSTFVGLDQAIDLEFTALTDESTRCKFCRNDCSRTFIETSTPGGNKALYISGFSCEKGTVEDIEALKVLNRERRERAEAFPNLAQIESKRVFASPTDLLPLPDKTTRIIKSARSRNWLGKLAKPKAYRYFSRSPSTTMEYRKTIRIGIPRCLDTWNSAPFWRGYFETLGISPGNLVFSRESGEKMFTEGAKYGSVDPCYPSKVVQAHVHDLIFKQHSEKRKLNFLFFPTVVKTLGWVEKSCSHACPVVTGTPNVIKAAFTKEIDFFDNRNIKYIDGTVNFGEPALLKSQLYNMWGLNLNITRDENDFAIAAGFRAMTAFESEMEERGKLVLEKAERDNRYCVLLLSRPYHLDPGVNHGVPELIQSLGYPVITLRSIPRDPEWLARFFKNDLEKGLIKNPFDVRDVWPEAHTSNSTFKVWGAKFAVRHHNVAILDLSSFKCGHDAPTYGLIDNIVSTANIPYLALHDLDSNRATGTLQIRIKTFIYSLKRREEEMSRWAKKLQLLEERMDQKRNELVQWNIDQNLPHPVLNEKFLGDSGN